MRWAWLLLVACKSQGTIDVEFDRSAAATCDGDAILYAVPNVSCTACDCGGCFGMAGSVTACDGICDSTDGVALDLEPGHWSVVLALIDPTTGLLRAQGCNEIDVDADGTADGVGDSNPAPVACVADECP